MAKTLDEKYLINFFEQALLSGDWENENDVFEVGRSMGKGEKAVKNIIKNLCKANFLKKTSDTTAFLTDNGYSLVQELISSS